MEENNARYRIIHVEDDGTLAEKRMNRLAAEGYRFVEMRTSGAGACLHITILMEKAE